MSFGRESDSKQEHQKKIRKNIEKAKKKALQTTKKRAKTANFAKNR